AGAARERAALGVAVGGRPRARGGARARRREPAAARADPAAEGQRRERSLLRLRAGSPRAVRARGRAAARRVSRGGGHVAGRAPAQQAQLRLGTRGSALALAQAGIVARALEGTEPGLAVELVEI